MQEQELAPPPEWIPYAAATSALGSRLCQAPLGRALTAEGRVDPLRRASAPFLDRLERLNALRYGPLGMASPRWVLYDCAELPGVIAGFACRARDLPPPHRAALDVAEGAPGLVPISMVAATPRLGEDRWHLYGLCALDGPLLAPLSMAIALLRARQITATAAWGSPQLDALARLGPLDLLAAWLPAHDCLATCVVRLDIPPRAITPPRAAPRPTSIDVADEVALSAVQREIEAGARVRLVGTAAGRAELSWEGSP